MTSPAPSPPRPQGWALEALWQQLQTLLPGISVELLPEVGSTNSLLLQRDHDPQPCLLVAERQTQGRGRMGRPWLSRPGASLTFSLALPLSPPQWEGLSLAVGLALAEALDPMPMAPAAAPENTRPRVLLKWPNDLWLCAPGQAASQSRKLGGILIETTNRHSQRWAVVGVGLNVAGKGLQDVASPAIELSQGLASLDEWLGPLTPAQVLARVALPLLQALKQFEAQGFAPLMGAYARRDALRGLPVRAGDSGAAAAERAMEVSPAFAELVGIADGVDEQGRLCLVEQGPDGPVRHRVHSGEVSIRLQPAVPPAARGTADNQGVRA